MRPEVQGMVQAAEQQMQAELAKARARSTHGGERGVSAEDAFRMFLREYVPPSFGVGHGSVLDTLGHTSTQCDVVLTSAEHPFTYMSGGPGPFFVEGVVAAGEVKAQLTGEQLDTTMRNAVRFRQLTAHHSKGSMILAGNESDMERFYRCPPYFLIAFESRLAIETVYERLRSYQAENGLASGHFIDAAFLLGRGHATDFGDGKGALNFRSEDGRSLPGWVWQPSNQVLFDFLAWVSAVMPRILHGSSILPPYMMELGPGIPVEGES